MIGREKQDIQKWNQLTTVKFVKDKIMRHQDVPKVGTGTRWPSYAYFIGLWSNCKIEKYRIVMECKEENRPFRSYEKLQ